MNEKVIGLLFWILLALHVQVIGQKLEIIDSLKNELEKPMPDTSRVQILFSISMKYQHLQPDSSMAYALATLKKATAIDYTVGRADALLHIGRLKRDGNNSAEGLVDMFAALKLYREINDKVQIANSLNDISIVYANSDDLEKALDYFKQALDIFQQMGDEKGESYALNNIGIIYQDLGDQSMAKDYFIRSLKIKEKNNDIYGISRGYTNLGSIAERNSQWNEALAYYFRADSLYKKDSDVLGQIGNFVAIARVYDKQGNFNEAKRYASMTLKIGQEVKAFSPMLRANSLLADMEEKKGNYKASLAFQKQYNQIADSLQTQEHEATLEELKTKFNFDEKEREIALLKKDKELQQAKLERKNILSYSLSAGLVLLLIIAASLYLAFHAMRSKKNELALKNSEIEKQKDELSRLNKEKDRFFSILSHDLKGPLNSLRGFSYLVTEHLDSMTTEELMEMRTKIDNSLDSLTELINNILEWSMTSSRKRRWTFDKINAADLIRKNISLYQTTSENKGVNLIYQAGDETLCAYADYYAIDTILRNLISNSIKFSHPKSDVIISATKDSGKIRISVKDHGVGIPQEIQDKLFRLDENVSQLGTNNERGTGLGLTLSNELIRENKGDISVKSKAGEGSEFIVSIPEYSHATEFVIPAKL